ncbi:MAG: PQQ-dependent sugar dehydrogenase, partial [Coriobacteriia bacterium]|nr:PQQ-dependent sugar dehydrogenase [Coriobacteriia bacterium]
MQARGVRAIAAVILTVFTLGMVPLAHAPAMPSVQLRFLERWTVNAPVGIENADDGTDRLFIIEQIGRIRLVKDGVLAATPFLDISNKVSSGGERGLLGLAFPPGFGAKQYFYVNYTNLSGNTVLARYAVSASDPDRADSATEEVLLTVTQPYANHNGGQLAFGPDGYLYISSGDGGGSGDPLDNGQRTDTLLGKILCIDTESGDVPYRVPASNPFVGVPGARPEIWALGLRNPWRFSFDRSTGALWIADVGQSSREEVNYEPPGSGGGRNYGWNRYEGSLPFPIGSTPTPTTGLTFPVFEYDRAAGRSITGGYVYRGPTQTGLVGLYLFADYVLGKFWALDPSDYSTQMVVDTTMLPSSFGEDEAGEIYVADRGTGSIFQLLDSSLEPPTTLTRIAGANRYQTAAAIARAAFPSGSSTAVVATGEQFPDALAASGLAGALGAPVLLTTANSAHPALLSALGPAPGGLGVTDVVIV